MDDSQGSHYNPVHFFVEPEVCVEEVEIWDPDMEPTRFSSGLGHNLLELYVRLRRRGLPVTIGHEVDSDAKVVVVFAQNSITTTRRHIRLGWKLRKHQTVIIRSDLPPRLTTIIRTDIQVAPNRTLVALNPRSGWVYLPPLPQRGLIPRKLERGKRVENVVYKGNPDNLPLYFSDPGFLDSIGKMGLKVLLDVPADNNGQDNRWHDFSDADICILDRKKHVSVDLNGKPPTKLLNSWHAGAIPVSAEEPAYLEIGEHGVNVLFFRGSSGLLDQLQSLRSNTGKAESMRIGIDEARMRLGTIDDNLMAYWELLQDLPISRVKLQAAKCIVAVTRGVIQVFFYRGSGYLRRRLFSRTGLLHEWVTSVRKTGQAPELA